MENNMLILLFGEYLKMLGFSENTIKIYEQKVISYLRFCNNKEIDYFKTCDINGFALFTKDKNQLSPSSLNVMTSALKNFYRFLHYKDLTRIRIEELHILSFKNKKRIVTVPSADVIRVYDYSRRMMNKDNRKLYINILYGTGVRPCDCVNLTSKNFYIHNNVLMMRFYEKKKNCLLYTSPSPRD